VKNKDVIEEIKMIRIAICDDDEYTLNVLKSAIDREFSKHTDDYNVNCYSNGILLLDDNKHTAFDVLFLDIDMPKISGFEIAQQFRDSFLQCFIIFVTSHADLVYRSFDFQPFNFIQKEPAESFDKTLSSVIDKLMEHMKQHKKIVLENDEETAVVYYHNIIYIESSKHYLKYHIQNKETPLIIRGSINEMESEISSYDFVRIHRGYIVNLKYIKSIDKKIGKVYINYNGTRKPLAMGASYKENVDKRFTLYLRNTL
jgi:DNA-binding LytR/AlgR family response regulator